MADITRVANQIKSWVSSRVSHFEETVERIEKITLYPNGAQFTLEESTNPRFSVTNEPVVDEYINAMGGYMMRVIDGTVYAAKLDRNDWNRFEDGTPADASICETMVHMPKCYHRSRGKTMNFGGLRQLPDSIPFDSPGWVGAYLMSVDGSGVGHSRPDVTPAHSRTMSSFDTCAKKNGAEWGQADYGFFCHINALYQAKYGNLNSQEAIGAGWQHSNWEACRDVPMGLTRQLGDGTGKVLYNDATVGNQYPTKLFGFEDLWGKLWEFRPGIRFYMDGETRYACVYGGNRVSDSADGRKFPCLDTANGEYAKTMELGEHWDMICQATGASSSTSYCDGYWAATGGRFLYVGGIASGGALCGLAFAPSNAGFSSSWPSLGARLAFYGEPVVVSGSVLMAM